MELYQEILSNVLSKQEIKVTFPTLKLSAKEIVEMECYQALTQIKAIIEDDSLADTECFAKIEAIVSTFEQLGSNGGNRHDFG